jgi:hypothetical protein
MWWISCDVDSSWLSPNRYDVLEVVTDRILFLVMLLGWQKLVATGYGSSDGTVMVVFEV